VLVVEVPYPFNFDLTRVSKAFFREIMRITYDYNMHRRMGEAVRYLIKKFRIREITGLDLSEAIQLVEDLIEIHIKNAMNREKFESTGRRALLLPHCSRKYMDSRCKARFDPEIPSYFCSHCSSDCLIHQATLLGEERGYDVYILPGGSCIKKILSKGKYDAVVGVACGMEINMAEKILNQLGIAGQAVPLIRNGCANTRFSIESLREIL